MKNVYDIKKAEVSNFISVYRLFRLSRKRTKLHIFKVECLSAGLLPIYR